MLRPFPVGLLSVDLADPPVGWPLGPLATDTAAGEGDRAQLDLHHLAPSHGRIG
jgi:hypothetical protein